MITVPEFGPLRGVNVVVCGGAIAGPFAAGMMADYGANVTFIENSVGPDMLRPGSFFQHAHRNQRSIALNIPTPQGKEIISRLIKEADIFIENSKAGQWTKWGLSDDVLWEINPKLVIAHASGYGQTGLPEYTKRGSWDAAGQAFGGMTFMNGYPDKPPIMAFPYLCDYYTAIYTSWSCLAAYINMLKTGQGESIDIAQYEVIVYSMADAIMNYHNRGQVFTRAGERNPKYGSWRVYDCKDGQIYVALAGLSGMRKGLPFLGLEFPSENFPEAMQIIPPGSVAEKMVEEKITAFCADHTLAEADLQFNANGIIASVIMTHAMMTENPQYKAREVITEWEDADGKMIKGPNTLLRFKNNPGQIWRGAPKYGQDNQVVLSSLGFSDEEIQEMKNQNIIVNGTKASS